VKFTDGIEAAALVSMKFRREFVSDQYILPAFHFSRSGQQEVSMSHATDTKVKDALDHVHAAMQDLHKAISDAATKHGGAVKADLEAFAHKIKAIAESLKGSIGTQHEAVKHYLREAVTHLEATEKHIAEALKASGHALQIAIGHALAQARASVEKVSEAIAARRR
jgi:hypothetical protein